MIQVRKQNAPTTLTGSAGAPRGPQFTVRQPNATTTRMFRPQVPQPRNVLPASTQRFTYGGRLVATTVAPQRTQPMPLTAIVPITSTVFTQQNGSISVSRAPQPNTPFGTVKTGNFHAI
jgi:hypothetical protein